MAKYSPTCGIKKALSSLDFGVPDDEEEYRPRKRLRSTVNIAARTQRIKDRAALRRLVKAVKSSE